jgi:hypothetical protein
MQQKPKRSRIRILAISALVGSVLSAGVATSDVSARSLKHDDTKVVQVKIDQPSYPMSFRSGIRW